MPISAKDIASLQKEFDLTYHVVFSKYCDELAGFAGKDVLEVGGSLPPEFVFEHLGAKSWTALESDEYVESLVDAGGIDHTGTQLNKSNNRYPLDNKYADLGERYCFFIGNIEQLPENFYSKYDLIFSINCFEHLQHLPESLDKMNKALRAGGTLFAIFAPIWSSFDGHHLPKIIDKSGKIHHQGESPIPPWGHLTMTPTEMNEYLLGHVDKHTAAKMVYYIYESPFINRMFPQNYMQCFEMCDLEIEHLKAVFPVKIDPEMQNMLEGFFPGNNQFANRGMLFMARRSD